MGNKPEKKEVMNMNRWEYIGPVWDTETVYRVLEILRGEKIPYKMPFSDVFFTSYFHPVSKERRWGIMVRRKDWGKVVEILEKEGLVHRRMLLAAEPEAPAAGSECGSMAFAAAASR